MTNKQDQRVSEGGSAIQVSGDAVINNIVPEQFVEKILVGLSNKLVLLREEAEKTVEHRLHEFKKELLVKFTDTQFANPEAFKEPDFQVVVMEAQKASMRRGSPEVDQTLTTLVAERSLLDVNSRIALTLNRAVEVAGILTNEEYAALSLIVLIRSKIKDSIIDMKLLYGQMVSYLEYVSRNISKENASYHYLASYGCAQLIGDRYDPEAMLQSHFGGLFQRGFRVVDGSDTSRALIAALTMPHFQDSTYLQYKYVSTASLRSAAVEAIRALYSAYPDTIQDNILLRVLSHFEKTWGTENRLFDDAYEIVDVGKDNYVYAGTNQFIADPFNMTLTFMKSTERMRENRACIKDVMRLFYTTPLAQLNLSPIGVAIGHAYLRRFFPDSFRDLPVALR